jgi:hypothetical protein
VSAKRAYKLNIVLRNIRIGKQGRNLNPRNTVLRIQLHRIQMWNTLGSQQTEVHVSEDSSVICKVKSGSRNRPWRPIGLRDVKDPTLSRQSAHRWRQGCQPHAPAALYSPETLFFL